MGSTKANNKRARRELAVKQAKRKKFIIIGVILVIVIALIAYFVINAITSSGAEVFSDGSQTVSFQSNGDFSASLSHGVVQRGTYTFSEQDDNTLVSFTLNGFTITSEIIDDHLHLPVEWHDACGHNFILPKR